MANWKESLIEQNCSGLYAKHTMAYCTDICTHILLYTIMYTSGSGSEVAYISFKLHVLPQSFCLEAVVDDNDITASIEEQGFLGEDFSVRD